MSLEGQQLGEFEILERLGQGGMGEVYKARQISLGRVVALKTLQSSLAGNVDYITRFRQEARAAAGLNHPNLVKVYSAGESEGLHWFAMEYVEGESARARLKREGRLDPPEAIAIAMRMAAALDYGWRKAGLIHRDIKPENIFLSGDGEIKLGDLGLAKSTGQAQELTMTGVSMGTPDYMSPEQIEGMKNVDLRADIYSLGCTLYHLLSGQPPYGGSSAVVVLMQHVSAPVPDLRSVWPECPAELAAAVGQMMQKQPADRQQNYGVMSADLQRAYAVLTGACVPSVVTGARQRVASRKPVAEERKSAAPVAAWIGGGVALLAAVGALLYFAPWKKGSAISGGTRSVVSQTPAGEGEGGKKVGAASSPTEATPASGRTVAIATTPQPEAPPVPATPAPVPQPSGPSTPTASTPAPSATPKPATEVEKWFAQVDGPQEKAFQKQVLKPFEAGVADLRLRYLASLDAAIAKASAGGRLAEALVWRKERQAFERAQNVATDDAGTPSSVQASRAAFRRQLTRLNLDRTAKAKALLAEYDAILAKNQTLLTQRQRLDDALLLKNERDEIALEWLTSKEQPFVNSLGMKFVPAPITGGPTNGKCVLFSAWDTRVQDYDVFVKETGREWPKTGFEQGPAHPAVNVSWEDAQAFCVWLTERERKAGKLGANEMYRLPRDHEWSCAAGIGEREDAAKLPSEKSQKVTDAFPWGTQWPPPPGAGNYGGEELQPALTAGKYNFKGVLSGYRDDFVETAPVGSFSANRFGLYDIGGNVWQWCEDWFDKEQQHRVVRGASWSRSGRGNLLSSYRNHYAPGFRYYGNGFRCVIASGSFTPPDPAAPVQATRLAPASSTPPASAAPIPGVSSAPATATEDAPFVNTLGMKFVPAPIVGGLTDGQRVLFSVWDTRVQDYEAFAKKTKREWPKVDFPQGPTHPAVMVSWEDAQLFCAWLTERERKAGKLGEDELYRLPSDHEWSCAAGLGAREDAAKLPFEKSQKIDDVFPWGTQWPPPAGAGNYAGEELWLALVARKYTYVNGVIAGCNDGFVNTSPVGSFEANRFGLYDIGGNVSQWCEDWHDKEQQNRVLRGGSWNYDDRNALLSSFRNRDSPGARYYYYGFRCVVASGSFTPTTTAASVQAASLAPASSTPPAAAAPIPTGSGAPVTATEDAPFVNTLGMKFVPVPIVGGPTDGRRVLFGVWDTRVQDYEAFAKETKREWPKVDFPQGSTHPAVMVSWEDAQLFCQWLTAREHAAGRLPMEWRYRLPSDHEWSCAVELGEREDVAKLPVEKSGKIKDAFPWGTQWPPPAGAGNYTGEELHSAQAAGTFTDIKDVIAGYNDGYVNTSPVGSFVANRFGLYDVGGNVWQWCEDWYAKDQQDRVLRGASWYRSYRDRMLSSFRHRDSPGARYYYYGFRCVVASGSFTPPTAAAPSLDLPGNGATASPLFRSKTPGAAAASTAKVPPAPADASAKHADENPPLFTPDTAPMTKGTPPVPAEFIPVAKQGKEQFERGNYLDAEKAYRTILAKSPRNLYALSNLGVVLFRSGNYELAEDMFNKAIAVAPEDGFSHCTLGIVYYQESKLDEAVNELSKALTINPKNPTAHNYLGITASKKGWPDVAQKELEAAVSLDANYADAYFNLAVVFATQQPPNKEEARKYYKRAIELGAQVDTALEQLIQ